MSELRLIGREVTIRLTRSGLLLGDLTAIRNFTYVYEIESKVEGYLGESGDRLDEIYKYVSGAFVIVPESPTVLDLAKMIADRATRRIANDEVVSCTFRATFPSGQTRRVTIPDMKFGNLPMSVPKRDEYVETSWDYKAETAIVSP